MISASGPSGAVSRVIGGSLRRYTSIGNTNAHVLPDPVLAMPMTSLHARPSGMHCICTPVGLSYPALRTAAKTESGSPDSGQKRKGRMRLPVAGWRMLPLVTIS